MGVDQTSLDRIRNATFPSARRGYDKHEVEKFLARLADWLETGGGGDDERSDAVKRELERVGERTGAILSEAEDAAGKIRTEAEEEARKIRSDVDAYAQQTRGDADAYAAETRAEVDREAGDHRSRMDREVEEALAEADSKVRRIVDEGLRRREDIESVIADLVGRRDEVLADIDELSAKLDAAVSEHRPHEADPYARPAELDPGTGDEPVYDEPADTRVAAEDDDTGERTAVYESDEQPAAGYGEHEDEGRDDEPDREDDDDGDTGEATAVHETRHEDDEERGPDDDLGTAEQPRPPGGEGGVRST